jgi:hypothetical protein
VESLKKEGGKVKYTEMENRTVVTGGTKRMVEMGSYRSKDTKYQTLKMNKSRNLIYKMRTIISTIVF